MTADFYQSDLEWENLIPENGITKVSFDNGLYSVNENSIIQFERDNQYNIIATISGIVSGRNTLEPNIEGVPGSFFPDETITAYSETGVFRYKFHRVFLGRTNFKPLTVKDQLSNFTADLVTHKIEQIVNQKTLPQITCVQEWFLSGFVDVAFPKMTKRINSKNFTRTRQGIIFTENNTLSKGSSSSRDYLSVQTEELSFIVSKVPKEFGPEWSFNLSIQYDISFGGIPDQEKRAAVSELVSFVFGTHLLKIGESHYDLNDNLIIRTFEKPWGSDVISKCQKPGLSPINIKDYNDWGKIERIFTELTPVYLKLRDKLGLNHSLWKYWLSRYSAIGANLPLLSSAVDTLAENILKDHKELKHYYIEPRVFSELLGEEIKNIETKIGNFLIDIFDSDKAKDIIEIIIRKIKNSSIRGSNEKLTMMFEILELPVGKIEKKAIKARNKMAHSSFDGNTDEELLETVRLTRAYETLFHRIFLKILTYNGSYIDYYNLNHLNRDIDEAIPE